MKIKTIKIPIYYSCDNCGNFFRSLEEIKGFKLCSTRCGEKWRNVVCNFDTRNKLSPVEIRGIKKGEKSQFLDLFTTIYMQGFKGSNQKIRGQEAGSVGVQKRGSNTTLRGCEPLNPEPQNQENLEPLTNEKIESNLEKKESDKWDWKNTKK